MTRAKPDANATPARLAPEAGSRRFRVRDVLRGTTLPNSWCAWGLLAVGLIISVLTSLHIKAGVEAAAQREFEFGCKEIQRHIEDRLEAASLMLRSGAALFDASDTVSRGEWRTFSQRLKFEKYLPGIQGIGFALLIPREQLDQHVQAIRGEGFPDYQVRPAGEQESYAPIIYLEPFSDRNLRAFGYDILSEPVRRAAMERARDENTAALSGKIILIQENDQDVQAGSLMYVPVYRQGLPIETIEQRRAAIQGWVYSPYRMTDLMRGTLGHRDALHKDQEISLQVYDGDVLSADSLLYDSQGATDRALASIAPLTRLTTVDFAGHRWTLRFTQPVGLRPLADYGMAWLVLFGATVSTLLLFGLTFWRQQRVRFHRDKAEAVEALRESEVRYRRLFESAKDGILILDAETGMVMDVNPFLVQLLGFSHEEFLGKKIWELGFFIDIFANHERFLELQQQKYIRYEDKPLQTADGRQIDVEFVSNVYLADHQKVIQCNIRDISERKRADEELQKAKDSAEAASRAKSDFLSSMSHELRTPLNAIIGFSEMLADKTFGELNEKQGLYVDNVLESGRYLLSLINDILDLSKVESGKMELELSTFRLDTVLDNSLVMVKGKCMKQGIALSLDVKEPIQDLEISADERKLKQILFNLLSNAVKFTAEGGAITVSARISDQFSVIGNRLSVNRDTPTSAAQIPTLLISVADTGIGIKPEDQERIFRAFEQVDSSYARKFQGTGLGLALVKKLVALHGGRVWVESEYGKGSTFWFTIPTGK
jgi:PAS domain S-box-containing protein